MACNAGSKGASISAMGHNNGNRRCTVASPTKESAAMPDSPSMPFTPQQALEFMQRMWNPFGMQVPNPAAMFATLDPAEIDRKIAELRVIENWLAMSQNFMHMSIKTLELQK